jgi:hypothetical protein
LPLACGTSREGCVAEALERTNAAQHARASGRRCEQVAQRSTAMSDLIYIGLTVFVFAVLGLLVWGVEHFER